MKQERQRDTAEDLANDVFLDELASLGLGPLTVIVSVFKVSLFKKSGLCPSQLTFEKNSKPFQHF